MKNKSQPDINTISQAALLIGCYSRVSTDEQANVIEGSLDNQRHRLQSFLDIKNLQEPGWGHLIEHFVDDGYSAKDTNRPAYERMMKALKSGKINAVMVTEISRLSRNIPDFCGFHKMLESQGAKFFSIKEQFDSSTPVGKMMLYNMINLAQFEREQTSERVAINCHSRAQRGFLNGGPSILGYDKDPAKKATFLINEEEAKHVQRIFDVFIEQRTLSRTIDAITAEGIKPKARDNARNRLVKAGRWTIDSLSFVLKNRSYISVREVNKGNKNKDQSKLKAWQRYGIFPASWPAIVDEVTFTTAAVILEENILRERMRLNTSATRVFAASGLCVCEECGRKLVGQSAHGKKQVHRYYVHSSKKGDIIDCTVKRIRAEKIETKLADYLSEILLQAGHFDKVEQRIRELASQSPEQLKTDKARLTMEHQRLTLAIKNTFKIQSALDAASEAIQETAKELEDLSRKKRHIEAELENLKTKEVAKDDVNDSIAELKDRLASFRKGWVKASAVMKKTLLKDLVYFVLVGPKGLKIQFRLKHGELNKDVTPAELKASKDFENNVIELAEKRRAISSAPVADSASADAGPVEGKIFNSLGILGSQVVGIGSGNHYLPELSQVHRKTTFSGAEKQRVFENLVDLYSNGLSLSDIAKQTGKPKTTIRSLLVKAGVRIRSSVPAPFSAAIRDSAKTNAAPYFGFCFFQGQVIPDPKEFVILKLIHELWKSGTNPNRIADSLNEKKIRPRCAQKWNRNSIVKIINRFENKSVILKSGGKYELR